MTELGGVVKAGQPCGRVHFVDDPARWDLIMVGDDGLLLFQRGSTEWIITPSARAPSATTSGVAPSFAIFSTAVRTSAENEPLFQAT